MLQFLNKMSFLRIGALMVGSGFMAWGQSIAVQLQMESISRQRAAIATQMQPAIEKQQLATQLQKTRAAGPEFFLLPRPDSLGGVTGSVVSQPLPAPPQDCTPMPSWEVDSMIGDTAQKEGLSADLLRGVMKQESGFRPCAVSSKGAMGLMQLMPATAEQFGIQNPFDPVSNLDAGARFLKQLLGRYDGDLPKALGAYNAGPAKVDAAGGVPAIPETMDFVKSILGKLGIKDE